MANKHYSVPSFLLTNYFFLFLLSSSSPSSAFPLSTSSRWIVDDAAGGQRVKLACVNLVSHLEPMVAEGLSKLPIETIAEKIGSMGFNCVRLTWPIYLVTDESLSSLTVRQSFQRLGLIDTAAGIQANNPDIVDLPLLQAFQQVVSTLGENNIMVILDNHITTPGWCCSNDDGNGFFNDRYFDPNLWLTGLTRMATLFNGSTAVVGMSLRNELRGPKQNTQDWYKYMQQGAEAVHAANPNVLVVVSGLNYDKDLSFLSSRMVKLSFGKKLVFEAHWYGFTDGQAWADGNANEVCGRVSGNMKRMSGFLLEAGYPLFFSEFGIDQGGGNLNDNRYINCFLGYVAEFDLDWAYWTIVGSYYLRQGVAGWSESYGLLDRDWVEPRNRSFIERISAVQMPFRGPGLVERRQHQVIFHPSTGKCVQRGRTFMDPLKLGPCPESDPWSYSRGTLSQVGTYFCLKADQLGKAVQLDLDCSNWQMISDSKMHVSSKLKDGTSVCMDVDSDGEIVANPCKCLSKDKSCEPESQWFKLVNSTRAPITGSKGESFLFLVRDLIWKFLELGLFHIGRMFVQVVSRIV
ncbi:unnamed protein product [Linum tenue]|uniref:Glycoside hydrolase family 5 domain-containing protein n=1 Tax=Linum tenue TaxID=586396 RepID=A0AAV0KU15_9ROSI|nr:unnamed protein product [Linum tenue]